MTARETMKQKLSGLGRRSRQREQIQLPVSAVSLWAETAICFLLSAVLAAAVLPGDCAPFGVALVAAAGSGLRGAAALLGSCFGYLCVLDFSQGLRHASAAVLTFAVAFAFYDVRWFRRPWVMPALGGAFTAITGSAATNCYGVKGMAVRSKTDGLVHLLRRESMAKGVKVRFNDDATVSIELHIIVDNGVNLTAVSRSIMSEVRYIVEKITGVKVRSVDVCVDSMVIG